MKLTIDRDTLREQLKAVVPAAARVTSIPAFAGVRIDVETEPGVARFTCTNFDLTITSVLEGITAGEDEDGSVIVPAHRLARLANVLPAGRVQLGTYDGELIVIAGDTEARLKLILGEGWPPAQDVDGDPITLTEGQLDDLRAIVGMASTDRTRPALTAVRFEKQRAGATDSYRLGLVDLLADMPDASVPADALTVILKQAGDGLAMTVAGHRARFTAGTTTWLVNLVETEWPKVDGLIPTGQPHHLAVNRHQLLEAVRRVTSIGLDEHKDDSGKAIALVVRLRIDGDKVIVEARQPDVGVVDDTIPCTTNWVSGGTLGFNPSYLADLLTACTEDDVTLEFADDVKPTVTRSDRRQLLLMPVRVT